MLRIADLLFSNPLILAPLAGYSDLPFRLLCRRCGAGYVVSEMISCHGLLYRQPNTLKLLASVSEEQPLSIQLFGADAQVMAEAANMLGDFQPAMIDLNMGCPVRKVTKRGGGAALMTTPKLAAAIITKVVAKARVPVTVKIRSGKDLNSVNAPAFAKMAEECGAAAVTVHARTWSQGFAGCIDRQVIAAVKDRVSIPVIGNGDVLSRHDALVMMAETGCDGVMIGRGALGNPWIFGEGERPNSLAEIGVVALEHLRLIETFLPAERMVGHIKSQLSRYFRELPGSSQTRAEIMAASDLATLRGLIETTAVTI
jgi:tRNA-dihydrouridine synthase B